MKCVSLSVCAWRLPHWAVHSAQHHHVGETANPEQHLWDRHPVSRPHSFCCMSSLSMKFGIFSALETVTPNTHTYIHTCLLTGSYKIPLPLSCSNNIPKGQRSALFITTVTQQRCLLTSGSTVTVAVSTAWPPDLLDESHQTLWFLQDVLRDQRATAHTLIPSTHLLICFTFIHLKAFTPGRRPVKPQSYTVGQCAVLWGISGAAEWWQYVRGFQLYLTLKAPA